MRILLILNATKRNLSIDRIAAIDFISIYGKDFDVSDENLHGDNNYRFSEFTAKREITSQALKELVLQQYVIPICNKGGFSYKISNSGRKYCERLNDDYASCFAAIATRTLSKYENQSDRNLVRNINEYAIAMFGGKTE